MSRAPALVAWAALSISLFRASGPATAVRSRGLWKPSSRTTGVRP